MHQTADTSFLARRGLGLVGDTFCCGVIFGLGLAVEALGWELLAAMRASLKASSLSVFRLTLDLLRLTLPGRYGQ